MSNFGNGFSYIAEEQKYYLAEGDYHAIISNVQDNKHLQNAVDVFFRIEGHPNASPYTMTLFARPVLGTQKKDGNAISQEDLEKWDRSMSRFFDAFGINKGDFDFTHWKNHTGYVTCKKNKNNDYCSLFVAFNQHKEAAAPSSAPAEVQKIAKAVGGTATKDPVPNGQPATPEGSFPEDIPF